jgi:hypothetical protein
MILSTTGIAADLLELPLIVTENTTEITGEAVDIQTISVELYPGETLETGIHAKNILGDTVPVTANLTGNIVDFMSIENPQMTLDPGEETTFNLYIYIPSDSVAGIYFGKIKVNLGREKPVTSIIPVNIRILESRGRLLEMNVKPMQESIPPAETLDVQITLYNLGESDLRVRVDLQLVDVNTKQILSGEEHEYLVEGNGYISPIEKLNITGNVSEGRYIVKGITYYEIRGGREREISSMAYIEVRKPFLELTLLGIPIWFFIAGFFILVGIYLIYLYHEREKTKKKRYLEAIDFTSLPQPGPASGFIGRIAETGIRAFYELDRLQTHTLVAGATGSGKTVAAQVLAEESLNHKKSVLVFDPTAQWTGFLRKNKEKGIAKLYEHFHLKEEDAKAFDGNIYTIKDPNQRMDVRKYMNPGEISIFCLNKLDPSMIDVFIGNTIREVFTANLEEKAELTALFVYDEIHRLLPKFGGSGKGFTEVERAVREFRKWGIGLVLISQVLSDFIGEIKANIGTEIQMRTRYEEDLERVKMKYGEDTLKSVVKANIGTGMMQNAQYNKGRPYFISFRPPLHNPHKLKDEELELYEKYNAKVDALRKKLDELKSWGVDVFDLSLELDLTRNNIKKGGFDIVELYIESLEPKINNMHDERRGKN